MFNLEHMLLILLANIENICGWIKYLGKIELMLTLIK